MGVLVHPSLRSAIRHTTAFATDELRIETRFRAPSPGANEQS